MLDRRRQVLLDQLAVVEHGIRFCYVPAGTFLMGSNDGDPDEQPVHAVRLGEYWMSETPVTWAAYCDLMGWSPPPEGYPREELTNPGASFAAREENKIRLQYCESETKRARDWHAHAVDQRRQTGGRTEPDQLFGPVEREDPSRPYRYDEKPMVAVAWQDALAMCERISTETVRYTLPSEAQWEKAARGGRIGQPYPWGFDEPDPSRCDFGHFGEFAVRPPRTLPSNGHGLFGMSGGVWEWTADVYDSLAYAGNTPPRQSDENLPRALRGGSWADCAEAVTVSFRTARVASSWTVRQRGIRDGVQHRCPNIGFRLCRINVALPETAAATPAPGWGRPKRTFSM